MGTRLERDMGLGLMVGRAKKVGGLKDVGRERAVSAFEHRVTRARQARLAAGAVSG